MLTDGTRIENLLKTRGVTATALARRLNISRSMLYAVTRNEKRLGRDRLQLLSTVEREMQSTGSQSIEPPVAVRESSEDRADAAAALRAENAALKAELRQALDTISNLSKALARRDEGRAEPSAPPGAAPAAGALYKIPNKRSVS